MASFCPSHLERVSSDMNVYEIITKKKHGEELSREEIFGMAEGYVKGEIPDYQISALLMAIYFNGMTDRETADLTEAITESGDKIDLSAFGELTADKHSTGGVGDKTTLIVAPLAAALGCKGTRAARWTNWSLSRDTGPRFLPRNSTHRWSA